MPSHRPAIAALAALAMTVSLSVAALAVDEVEPDPEPVGVYSIEGSWDDPVVNFDRIFDDEVRLGGAVDQVANDPNSPAQGSVEAVTEPPELSPAGGEPLDPNQPAP